MKTLILVMTILLAAIMGCTNALAQTLQSAPAGQVRFDGFFRLCQFPDDSCHCPKEQYYTRQQLVFFPDGRVCELVEVPMDSLQVVKTYNDILNKTNKLYGWGKYEIRNHIIQATINSISWGRIRGRDRWSHEKTKYEGDISPEGCIVNWQRIAFDTKVFGITLQKGARTISASDRPTKTFIYHRFPAVSLLSGLDGK